MPINDLEVFDRFLAEDGTDIEIDYLAYAVFAFRKACWSDRWLEVNGNPPNQQEIDTWITGLSEYDFSRMRDEAVDVFDIAARRYMREDIEQAREEGCKESYASTIVEVKSQIISVGRFRNQLLIALMTAIMTPIILGGSIILLRAFEDYMPKIFQISGGTQSTNPPAASPPFPTPPASPTGTPPK
jgi:hypothetical protein